MLLFYTMKNNVLRLWAPLALYLLIFIFKAVASPGELIVTVVAILAVFITFLLWYNEGEFGLLMLGVMLGMFIEVGLTGVVGERQQIWLEASLFGIPYWLPIMWGIAFVVLPRIGIYIRKAATI